MGAYRSRRPFVWQDEMAEVRNLFHRVAKVRKSGFTGFSLWKDEPTAETLSRNRLRRRRSQYALKLTHLNYGESPYDSLNHLHNIRGMCSRIQRQDRFVERKKKDYDVDLQPALLRRPVTVSYSSTKEGSEKAFLRFSRPGSAPVRAGTPLHYTPSRPTMLYDATHRCPRYKEFAKRPFLSSIHNKSGRSSSNTTTLKAMADNYNWEPTAPSVLSSPMSSSIASSTRTTSIAPSASPSFSRLNVDSSTTLDEMTTNRRKGYLEPVVYSEVEVTSDVDTITTSALNSEVESIEASVFSSSRPPSVGGQVERPASRPPSRMMSKRPPADVAKADKCNYNVPHCKAVRTPPGDSAVCEITRSDLNSPPFATPHSSSRPPSRKAGDGARLLDEQRSKSLDVATGKAKSTFSPLADGATGLWALRQDQQRPMSAGAMIPQPPVVAATLEQANVRPLTSPTPVVVDHFLMQERVSRYCSSPSTNKIAGKKEKLQVHAAQRAFDKELQQVVLSESGNNETNFSIGMEQELKSISSIGQELYKQERHHHPNQVDAFSSGGDSLVQATDASATEQVATTMATTGDDESHIMIKQSTDPYADFKNSMLHMILEEKLYDKEWELEELFQYYMDLNPAVHHEVLKLVISDIRRDIAADKARHCQVPSS